MNDCIQTIQIVFVDASRSKNKLISSFLFVCEIILDTFFNFYRSVFVFFTHYNCPVNNISQSVTIL